MCDCVFKQCPPLWICQTPSVLFKIFYKNSLLYATKTFTFCLQLCIWAFSLALVSARIQLGTLKSLSSHGLPGWRIQCLTICWPPCHWGCLSFIPNNNSYWCFLRIRNAFFLCFSYFKFVCLFLQKPDRNIGADITTFWSKTKFLNNF